MAELPSAPNRRRVPEERDQQIEDRELENENSASRPCRSVPISQHRIADPSIPRSLIFDIQSCYTRETVRGKYLVRLHPHGVIIAANRSHQDHFLLHSIYNGTTTKIRLPQIHIKLRAYKIIITAKHHSRTRYIFSRAQKDISFHR